MSDIAPKKTLETWHASEKAIQATVGVVDRMAVVGQRVIRDHMPDQHREFYAQLPFIVVGSVDHQGDAWASFVAGQPGFVSSPTPTILDIDARTDPGDPVSEGLTEGDPIGLLGIELHTRRRNRMNGVLASSGKGLRVEVDQSFGNCPRYIQLRNFAFVRDPAEAFAGVVEETTHLDADARAMIAAADVFFVAPYAEREDLRPTFRIAAARPALSASPTTARS